MDAQGATNSFEKDILAFEAADRANPPAPGAILLAGDSQFTLWKKVHEDLPEYRIINRGFGGSKITDLLYDSFMGANGKPREELFVADKLHNSAAGYAVRVKFLRPILGPPDFPGRKPAP